MMTKVEEEGTGELQPESTPSFQFSPVLPMDRRVDALGDLRLLPDEILCSILAYLSPRDVARLACVSSVMYIFCNEEPLWMTLCLQTASRPLQFKDSWKKTTLHQLDLIYKQELRSSTPLHFEGFYSHFLYRRLYRCYTSLNGFSFDDSNVERRNHLSFEEFNKDYDVQKPVLILGLSDTWPAKNWTPENLVKRFGDTTFRLSQRGPKKISMKFGDYASYMQMQHDEDPLYVFDDEFGEVAPSLLEEYSVPHLFQEDFFDVLSKEDRPPFRWLIIGPERSGAAWHVDPSLTSAWNTLLHGRKRWALYPPGKVPIGVTVHVNEDDGEVHIDTPTSLQWWLDFYPLLSNEDKPIECTQLPGETIFVPSGWWHCVLNLETTVAVTQNFVNSKNFEFVCLDMAPGFKHKGVCRAGMLALEKDNYFEAGTDDLRAENAMNSLDLERKGKKAKTCQSAEDLNQQHNGSDGLGYNNVTNVEFSYNIDFLSTFLDKGMNHFISLWSSSNVIDQRKMREWLFKLWVRKPELRDLIWKGACLALNASGWFECLLEICKFHGLPLPKDEEKLPVGTGSNPVYLVGDNVIKIVAEGGSETALYGLGTELEFYNLLDDVHSQLKNYVPRVLGSGILYIKDGSYKVLHWDGIGVPEGCSIVPENHQKVKFAFGIQNKMLFEYRKPGFQQPDSLSDKGISSVLPYVVTERCRGRMFAELRETLSWDETLALASFLGEKLRILHLLPCQSYTESRLVTDELKSNHAHGNGLSKAFSNTERDLFIKILNKRKKDIHSQLAKWGNPISSGLIDKVDEYLPEDFVMYFAAFEDDTNFARSCTWIHSDVMDDNIQMEQSHVTSALNNAFDSNLGIHQNGNDTDNRGQITSWHPCHLIDFSNLSFGHPICDLIPIHLDIFRGDSRLLNHFFETYKLPIAMPKARTTDKFGRASYLAMCLCILHDDNVLAAIFSLWKELKMATSWEEIEEKVWGDVNNYKGFSTERN